MTRTKISAARAAARRPARPIESVDLTTTQTSSSPVMPHERDEKVGMTGGVAGPRVQQGARDLKRGIVETSRAVEADDAYEKLKR